MKLNSTKFYVSHKSKSCFSKSGNPLSVYKSLSEAQESADYQLSQSGVRLSPYRCSICGDFHLKPTDFFVKKIISSCSCTDHNGRKKDCYETRSDAEKMASIRASVGIQLYVYSCPQGIGFHLTSRKEY